jgi:hypothetical protein
MAENEPTKTLFDWRERRMQNTLVDFSLLGSTVVKS